MPEHAQMHGDHRTTSKFVRRVENEVVILIGGSSFFPPILKTKPCSCTKYLHCQSLTLCDCSPFILYIITYVGGEERERERRNLARGGIHLEHLVSQESPTTKLREGKWPAGSSLAAGQTFSSGMTINCNPEITILCVHAFFRRPAAFNHSSATFCFRRGLCCDDAFVCVGRVQTLRKTDTTRVGCLYVGDEWIIIFTVLVLSCVSLKNTVCCIACKTPPIRPRSW